MFFFARLLTSEKSAFDIAAASVFSGQNIHVTHDDSGPLAELEAMTSMSDHAWVQRHPEVFATFDRDVAPIVSFQGGRFGPFSER